MKSMINTAPESIEVARSEGFYELIALSRHYQPRVRRYALAILETSRLPPETASDRQVLAEPFEKLSFLMLLDVWNRMRRTQQQQKSAKSDDESEADEPKNDFKKTDNAEVAASLYEMDEYRFISKFVAEKDEISAKEQATREKILAKRKSQEVDETEGLDEDDEEEIDEEMGEEDAELEAEADAIMQQAIKKHASSAFGNEEEDDDFAYEAEDSEDDEDMEDIEAEISDDSEDSDNEDYDALFVDSDAENIELLSGNDEDDIEDEEEEPVTKKSKKSGKFDNSEEQNKKQKKKKKSVFAAASDYEDALQD